MAPLDLPTPNFSKTSQAVDIAFFTLGPKMPEKAD
jgi:hypothetical protein